MNREEEVLIYNAQKGNVHSFEALIKKYDRKILNLLLGMVNSEEDTKDIYQEVFLKVFKSMDKFKFQSEFYTWLFRIAINTAIDYRRKKSLLRNREVYETETIMDLNINTDPDPERYTLNKELNKFIQLALDKLSPKQRAVFTLRHYNGLKLLEIAEHLSCSQGTVKKYLFRATQKLQHELQQFYEV